ncbi:NADP-dependent oxidoreductase [Conservatibacter flavescens]|uniref:NADP-dependent oxidoreductase n=1 Tax=Conservatibacter flavescens TaxID=28161 RepID=A0A2M8S1E0_9PAST|nr:NADP-dependent oxidoreductase [Conservatibacter flavescens]PJG84971.1 NADP-dependent oxidoreductase [Conservatibacter flavescens]
MTFENYGVTISAFGDEKVLQFQPHLVMPTISETQVLIENHIAGLNPVDYKTRLGLGWGAEKFKQHFPAVLGFDFAGIVVQAGRKSGFQVGERVAALSFEGGAYSRYAQVEANLLARLPENVSFEQAGALPTAGITAYQLVQQAQLQPKQTVLISAPVGGVGHLLVQLLAQQGVNIVAICSPNKAKLAHSLGAQAVLDYTNLSVFPDLQADLFIDLVGGEAGVKALRAVKQGGRVICVPTIHVPLLQEAGESRGLIVEKMLAQPNALDLSVLLELVSKQKLQVLIEKIYPIQDIQQAHHDLAKGKTVGKLLLTL